jgi:circadian clock protein KaiC
MEPATTGVSGLDEILQGGLPVGHLYLVQGAPGVGKTTLGLQFLRDGARQGEKSLYITLSETRAEINAVAQSHGWSLDAVEIFELSAVQQLVETGAANTVFHPAEVELGEVMRPLLEGIETHKPRRVVLDSLSEIRLLAQGPLHYRKQILKLKQFFAGRAATVMLLDDLTSTPNDLQLESLCHGVINLEQLPQGYGTERRRMRIAKLRGVKFRGGHHDYKIDTGGLIVYPRLTAAEHRVAPPKPALSSGLTELDALLGGGLDAGTSTLITGAAGTGKSSVMVHYADAAAKLGMRPAIFTFDEHKATMIRRSKHLGIDLQAHLDSGALLLRQVDPAELAPDELAHEIRRAVDAENRGFVAIDSLNGYLHAMPDEKFLTLQLHELLTYLSNRQAVTMLVLAQGGIVGGHMSTPVDVSYIADTVVLIRYFEALGRVRKAISVIKKRSSAHEQTIRELSMGIEGLKVGQPLTGFQGVLQGVPMFVGDTLKLET